jgi:hypothetical protein
MSRGWTESSVTSGALVPAAAIAVTLLADLGLEARSLPGGAGSLEDRTG